MVLKCFLQLLVCVLLKAVNQLFHCHQLNRNYLDLLGLLIQELVKCQCLSVSAHQANCILFLNSLSCLVSLMLIRLVELLLNH